MSIPLIFAQTPATEVARIEVPPGIPVVEVAHTGVTMADLGACFDAGFRTLAALGPVGPGYAIYDGDLASTFDLTIGFPISTALAPADLTDGVNATTFPAGPVLLTSHLGGFEGLGASWQAFAGAHREAGNTRCIEIYVTDPSVTAVEDLRTDLLLPLTPEQ